LSMNPTTLCLGQNSGYQAINVAVLLGARKILLLGYDMQRGEDGARHWHEDHKIPTPNFYPKFLKHFPTMIEPLAAAGVEVWNCTRRTALDAFPKVSLEDALAEEAAA
jgi:hypothetical protein